MLRSKWTAKLLGSNFAFQYNFNMTVCFLPIVASPCAGISGIWCNEPLWVLHWQFCHGWGSVSNSASTHHGWKHTGDQRKLCTPVYTHEHTISYRITQLSTKIKGVQTVRHVSITVGVIAHGVIFLVLASQRSRKSVSSKIDKMSMQWE